MNFIIYVLVLLISFNCQSQNLPTKFDTVPIGNNVYRSNQPTLTQLKIILKNYNINKVIRMNGLEGTGVSIESEKRFVENLGKEFLYINAHIGYENGFGYVESINLIQPHLKQGNVLIHCTAGADRTGYQIGRFIKDNTKWSNDEIWRYTIQYNSWPKHICYGRWGYIKYMEAFYSLKDWCKEQKYVCKICDRY
tara:strand:+ start:3704 stop:4285 length:582 start_codon:yes stop_codon:yes gene_type:complete